MDDYSSLFAAIAAVAAAISAIVSLIQQIKSKKLAAAVRKINNDTIWYNKIALDTIVILLNSLIDKTEQNIINCKKDDSNLDVDLRIVNKELNADINSLNELIDLLKVFDKDLCRECSKCLENIRDNYSSVINKSLKNNRVTYYNTSNIHVEKKIIVEHLWEFAHTIVS